MDKAYRSSEFYVVAYVLAVLGAKVLGFDFNGIDPSTVQHANQAVQQVADAYRSIPSSGGDVTWMAGLGGLWVGARSILKALDTGKRKEVKP